MVQNRVQRYKDISNYMIFNIGAKGIWSRRLVLSTNSARTKYACANKTKHP